MTVEVEEPGVDTEPPESSTCSGESDEVVVPVEVPREERIEQGGQRGTELAPVMVVGLMVSHVLPVTFGV